MPSKRANDSTKKHVKTLLDYIKNLSSSDLHTFSSDCGTTTGNLMQIAYGGSVSAKLAKVIHEKSNKAVLLEELRPDIFS